MKYFSKTAFEHLLFPLHTTVYRGIDRALCDLEGRYPGLVSHIVESIEPLMNKPTDAEVLVENLRYPTAGFDIYIEVHAKEFSRIRKSQAYASKLLKHDKDSKGKGQFLIVRWEGGDQHEAFIVPLGFILKDLEARVCRKGAYQVYEHVVIREFEEDELPNSRGALINDCGTYIGVTRRSWQQRYKEHVYATRRGSLLRFHQALRGELFPVDSVEHQVLRAGLTESEALDIEEAEVENRTLAANHPNGLNMIPGGKAGLQFLSTMTGKKREELDVDATLFELENVVNKSLRQPGLPTGTGGSNEKLKELWQNDLNYRIKVMTGNEKRLTYPQIVSARIWHASGWSMEKIHEKVCGMGDRDISFNQIKSLLEGKTYSTIPHVLLDL
ncbi:hypothetical protein IB286_14250 [Spongiibacter sp. KMU-158]|uniref:Uncharacterized protein n=1 Tax=Spongiibacter pelagi TaxID=2760804 RepID=A0A927C2L7_9GAMM|nr:hypothetical protein [Spongiibacter pelagi]MBD2860160.1 hypothetical protein [Spongiibacter pelagi]